MNLSQFQQKVSVAGKPVIVDFWAAWCVPCRVTKPILESLAKEYYNQVEFLAINADEAQDILEQNQVIGIPTVLSLIDGQVIGGVTGAQNEANYRKNIWCAGGRQGRKNFPVTFRSSAQAWSRDSTYHSRDCQQLLAPGGWGCHPGIHGHLRPLPGMGSTCEDVNAKGQARLSTGFL